MGERFVEGTGKFLIQAAVFQETGQPDQFAKLGFAAIRFARELLEAGGDPSGVVGLIRVEPKRGQRLGNPLLGFKIGEGLQRREFGQHGFRGGRLT